MVGGVCCLDFWEFCEVVGWELVVVVVCWGCIGVWVCKGWMLEKVIGIVIVVGVCDRRGGVGGIVVVEGVVDEVEGCCCCCVGVLCNWEIVCVWWCDILLKVDCINLVKLVVNRVVFNNGFNVGVV